MSLLRCTVQSLVLGQNVNLHFLPCNSRKDLKFHTQLALALFTQSYRLLNAVFSRGITEMEASFVGPVVGQRTQISATKECARFLRINDALLPFVNACACFFAHLVYLLSEFKRGLKKLVSSQSP